MTTTPPVGSALLERCDELHGSELSYPFGPEVAVFKVCGKMFALFTGPDEQAPDRVSLKCDPEYAAALVRDHAAITPGYHLNKRHWISIDLSEGAAAGLPDGLAEDLLVDSYDLVVAALPATLRRSVATRPVRDLKRG